jgi:hypothetical protein
MPTGTTRVTLFGGSGGIPAGSQTFNTSGTFSAPVGLRTANLSARGGSGNPGNPGNPGNAGNSGTSGTQNAISVTGGTSYPVTVGPGGFATISWSAQ